MSLQELDKLNRSIKQKSLEYKVNKEYGQETLKEFYKPILDVKAKEQDVIKEQHKELQEELKKQQLSAQKQQLLVPLIKSLSDHPRIVAVLKGGSDGSDLTGKEQHILKQLQDIDDRTLITLIDYFSDTATVTPTEAPGVPAAVTPTEVPGVPAAEVLPPEYTKIPPNIKSDKLGEWLINHDLPNKQSAKILFEKGRDGRSVDEIKGGIADFVEELTRNGTPPSFREKPWTTIKAADPEFYKQLGKLSGKSGKGMSDLVKKLEILYASKLAGNNNVLTEASEILDKLRRDNVIDIDMLKEVSKRFNSNK